MTDASTHRRLLTRPVRRGPAGVSAPRPVIVVLALLFVLGVYSLSLLNGFIYDDLEIIVEQPVRRTIGEFAQIFAERHFPGLPYYRPITRTTLLLQKTLHGDAADLFHLANAVLMAITAWFAYRLMNLPALSISPWPALFSATWFAVHPIASACVHPISSGRESLLPSCFTIAAAYAFFHGGRSWYFTAVACFAAALLSKEQAVIVPGVFILGDILRLSPDSPGKHARKWLRRYCGIALLLMVYFVVRWRLFHGAEYQSSFAESPAGPFWSLLYALQTIFAPFATLAYEPRIATWFSPIRMVVSAVAIGILTVAVRWNWNELRVPALFWSGWFLLTLLPTANLIDQQADFAERYLLLPLLAVVGLWGGAVSQGEAGTVQRRMANAVSLALIVTCGAISWNRAEYYRDEVTFHRQWVGTDPQSLDARVNLGLALFMEGDAEQAIPHLRAALDIDPNYAGAHINLGNALMSLGRFREAEPHYRSVLTNAQDRTHHSGAHYNLGLALEAQGRLTAAIEHYQRAVALEPNAADIHISLGNLRFGREEYHLAETHFRRALELTPNSSPRAAQLRDFIQRCDKAQLEP